MSLQQREAVKAWEASPLRFVLEAFDWPSGQRPTKQQTQILEAVEPGAHISVRSGHGTGKTALLSWLILWFLCTRPMVRIPCTATTGSQLRDILWPELSKWISRLPADMAEGLEWQSERILVKHDPTRWYAVARTARPDRPDALQGFHDDQQLFVVDEASGVPDEVFQVAEGALTSAGVIFIMAGNPTRLSGTFYRSHHQDRHMFKTFALSSADSEIVNPAYAERIARKYGRDSDVYRVRVLGEFPRAEADQFIALPDLLAAQERDPAVTGGVHRWGVDPARFGGDETALVCRHGDRIYRVEGRRSMDTMAVAGWIANEFRLAQEKPTQIMVDVIGIGAGVYDRLNELGLPVVSVNVAESASRPAEYYRLRDELWGLCRDHVRSTAALCRDEELVAQLAGPKYGFRSTGAIEVESKDDMRGRGLDSPDRADALCLTYYEPRLVFAWAGRG